MKNLSAIFLAFLISVIVFIGIRPPRYFPQLQRTKPITVLLYNHITPSFPKGQPFSERYYYVSTQDFEQQLIYLKKRGFTFLSRDGYNDAFFHPENRPNLPLLILFRDGNDDIATYGLPILQKYNIPAVVFYHPTSQGKPHFLTKDQVNLLKQHNVAVLLPNPEMLDDPTRRNEVSGVINLSQFEDLLPPKQYDSLPWALAIATGLGLLAILALTSPTTALVLPILLLPTYLIRFTILGAPATLLELVVLVVFLGTLVREHKRLVGSLRRFHYWPQTILFLIAAGLSTYYAKDRMAALGGVKAYVIEPILFALVCAYWMPKKPSLAKQLLWAYVVGALTIALVALKNFITGTTYVNFQLERLTTYFGNPNYLATYLAIALVIVLFFLLFESSALLKKLAAVSFVVLVAAFYFAKSDTATIGVVAAVGLLVLYKLKGRLHLPAAVPFVYTILGILVSLALFMLIANYRTLPTLEKLGANTLVSRSYIYKTTQSIIRDHLLYGVGLLNYNSAFVQYVSEKSPEQNVALAHNTLFDFWAQMGIIALVAYLWMVIHYFRIGFTNTKTALSFLLMALFLALVIHGMLDSQYHKNDYSLIFWWLIGMSAALPKIASNQHKVKKH